MDFIVEIQLEKKPMKTYVAENYGKVKTTFHEEETIEGIPLLFS